MKLSVGSVLAATLALTYPVQASNTILKGRDAVPANEADMSQKEAITKLLWIREEAISTSTPSGPVYPSSGGPLASNQGPSASPYAGSQGGQSTGSSRNVSNTLKPSNTHNAGSSQPDNPKNSASPTNSGVSGTPNYASKNTSPTEPSKNTPSTQTPLRTASSDSNNQSPSESPKHSQSSLFPQGGGRSSSVTPSISPQQTEPSNPSNPPISSQSSASNSHDGTESSAATPSNKAQQTESPSPSGTPKPSRSDSANSHDGTGSSSAPPSDTAQQTESPTATQTSSSSPDFTIESSMVPITTGGHTTTEAVLIPRTTIKVTKGQETSSVIFTATSVTTSKGSNPTLAWGCVKALSDLCGAGKTNSGGGSSGGCLVPLLCPTDKSWGLGGGWLPSGNPGPGGPSPPPSAPKSPSDSGSDHPKDDPDKDNTTDDNKKTTTTDKKTSSTKTSASSTSTTTSESEIRLCLTYDISSISDSGQTTTTSSSTSISTSTPTSEASMHLCLSVYASGTVTDDKTTTMAKTDATTTADKKNTTNATATSDKKSDIITSTPTTFSTTTKDSQTSMCRLRQKPGSPESCICTSGTIETMLATQSKGDECGYTKLPDKPSTTDDAPTLGPTTSTMTHDVLVIWPTQITSQLYVDPQSALTETYPAGNPTTTTITANTPKPSDWSPKGSSICGTGIGGDMQTWCENAYNQYDDLVVYSAHTKRNYKNGVGYGCIAEYKCDSDDDYINLNGKQLKELFADLYKDHGIKRCGSAKLSEKCKIKVDYCNNSGCSKTG